MLKKVHVKNFKSQVDTVADMGQFSVFTGYNAAGKTTMLQALVFLKQSLSRKEVTFNDYLLRLGDFREIVYEHDESKAFEIGATLEHNGKEIEYNVLVAKNGCKEDFYIDGNLEWTWDARSPYSMEPSMRLFLSQAGSGYGGGTYTNPDPTLAIEVAREQQYLVEWFENMLYLSSSRGFTKYSYPLLAGQPEPEEVARRAGDASLLEEWLANLILYRINEANRYPELRDQLNVMRERLSRVGIDINPYVMNGPSVVIDLCENGMWVSAVNSGYGINQLVSFVALGTLLPKDSVIMIEEPEIHLHPKMQRIVCDILAEISDEGKQVVITTHSEHFLKTLAKRIDAGTLAKDNLKVYHYEKVDRVAQMTTVDVQDEKLLEELF